MPGELISLEAQYTCRTCGETRDMKLFSKTQLNRLVHKKISLEQLCCSVCTSTMENDDKKRAAENAAARASKVQKRQEEDTQRLLVSDPSLVFIKNPLDIPIVKEAKEFFSQRKNATFSGKFSVTLGDLYNWRTVAKLAVRDNGQSISIGLFEKNSHDVLSCVSHPSHHPAINEAVAIVDYVCNRPGGSITGYRESTGQGMLRYLLAQVETHSTQVQVTLVCNIKRNKDEEERSRLQQFVHGIIQEAHKRGRSSLLKSVWVNYNAAAAHVNRITDYDADNWELMHPVVVTESAASAVDWLGRIVTDDPRVALTEWLSTELCPQSEPAPPPSPPRLYYPPFVFRQANWTAFQGIIYQVRHWLGSVPGCVSARLPRCLELYGGVGTIGLSCVDRVSFLHCSDENPFNEACFLRTAQSLDTRAVYTPKRASAVVAAASPLAPHAVGAYPGVSGFDVVLVDPPRKGLDEEVLAALSTPPLLPRRKQERSRGKHRRFEAADPREERNVLPRRLIYVSCGFKAFKRDCDALLAREGGWTLVHAEGHVLFPGSDHVETLAVFDRR